MKRLLLGVPAYNEHKTIAAVLDSFPKTMKNLAAVDVLVVDDGSTDQTGAIARDNGVLVARHLINRGLGGALRTIFSFAKKKQYDYLITFDADGQHAAKDLSRVIAPLFSNDSDVVVGSRWRENKRAPRLRVIVNKLANLATYLFFGIATSDSQSGFRAFNKKAIGCIRVSADGMDVSSEFFKEIYHHRLRYQEVAIDPIYTKYSQRKGQKISNFPVVLFELFMKFLRQ